MLRIKYTWDDKPFREFLVAMKEFGRDSIAVGILDGALDYHPGSDITTGEVAAIMEFGTEDGHVPARPFIGDTFRNTAWVRDVLAQSVRSVISGRQTPRQALNRAGRIFADGVRNTLLNGVPPANAPATIRRKGHGDTLIHTGALYDAIAHKIIKALK